MAQAALNQSVATGLVERARMIFATLRGAVEKQRVKRQTMAELNALSDHDLRDLGIARSQIRSIAHEAAYDM